MLMMHMLLLLEKALLVTVNVKAGHNRWMMIISHAIGGNLLLIRYFVGVVSHEVALLMIFDIICVVVGYTAIVSAGSVVVAADGASAIVRIITVIVCLWNT